MLELSGLNAHYGDSHILHDVDLSLEAGQSVAILGRNGAGKTTTLKTILGYVRATKGSIYLEGRRITNLPTHRIVRRGLGYVPENRGIFRSLTVREHLALAAKVASVRLEKVLERLLTLFPRLAERAHALGDSLSGGEQQMLAIARALVAEPKLLVLDEPSEGLAPVIIEDLERLLLALKGAGQSILLVEQNYHLATAIADRVYVMGEGRIHFHGCPRELEREEELKSRHLGI